MVSLDSTAVGKNKIRDFGQAQYRLDLLKTFPVAVVDNIRWQCLVIDILRRNRWMWNAHRVPTQNRTIESTRSHCRDSQDQTELHMTGSRPEKVRNLPLANVRSLA